MKVDVKAIRERWVRYNLDLVDRFTHDTGADGNSVDKLKFFAVNYLIDFESELEEDPDNEDGGILALDTVFPGYIDSFLGRWYIQNVPGATEEDMKNYQKVLSDFYKFIKKHKLYKEGSGMLSRLLKKLEAKKKYLKRLKSFIEIQAEKEDEEKYLDLMQEWEYEDL